MSEGQKDREDQTRRDGQAPNRIVQGCIATDPPKNRQKSDRPEGPDTGWNSRTMTGAAGATREMKRHSD